LRQRHLSSLRGAERRSNLAPRRLIVTRLLRVARNDTFVAEKKI
jgi:hypothetical protein